MVCLVLLEAAPAEDEAQLGEGEGDGYLGVGAGLGRQVVEPLGQVDVLAHAVAQLVHVAEVEHGLRVVLEAIVRSVTQVVWHKVLLT